ncbi:MAG: hypothetical protein V4651_14525 [Bacteroidota bacterium]
MLNLFRQNTALSALLLVLLALALKLPVFFWPHPYTFIQTAPLANTVFTFLQTFPNYLFLSYVLAAILLISQALFLNYIVVQHGILYRDTFLPGLFFIIANSLYPQQAELTPQLISNTFIILMFQRLCFLYESPNPLLIVLDAGMYLGMALLFNYDVAVFLPFILISVVIFTSFNFRYLILSVLGITIPLYFAAVVFYLNNNLASVIEFTRHSLERTLLKSVFGGYDLLIPAVILLPLIMISAVNLQLNFFRNKVKTRRILQSVVLLFLFGALGLVIENTHFIYALFYLSIPLSIVIAYYFISDKRFLLKEIVFFVLLGLCVYYNVR